MGRKHWEKEKLLVTSNFSFPLSVFKRLALHTRKNQGLFGKRLKKTPEFSPFSMMFSNALQGHSNMGLFGIRFNLCMKKSSLYLKCSHSGYDYNLLVFLSVFFTLHNTNLNLNNLSNKQGLLAQ